MPPSAYASGHLAPGGDLAWAELGASQGEAKAATGMITRP
jgi:hypothetical protein